jgi:hypothetical protein
MAAPDHHRGNHLQLQTQARVAGNLVEADGIQQGSEAGEGSGNDKHGEGYERGDGPASRAAF